MSGSEPGQPRAGEERDADGYRVEERAESEECRQTKEVREDGDRTEIHLKDEKVVRLEEVKTKETVRLASPEEVRALIDAEFEGLDEISAGKEVTVEEFNRKESRHEKHVDGQPVVEFSLTEERKSKEVKEDPQWKKDDQQFPNLDLEKEMNISLSTSPSSDEEAIVVAAKAPAVELPTIVSIPSEQVTLTAETPASADARVLKDESHEEAAGKKSPHDKSKGFVSIFAKKKPSKEKHKDTHGPADVEMENDVAEEYDILDHGSSRRHEIKHKRHIIEEVVIEDSDKFYEKQEKRPRLFLKGTPERRKESPMETASLSYEAPEESRIKESLKPPDVSLHAESLPNITTTESITYVVEHDQKATSGHVDGEGQSEKTHVEYKWYSFPRKQAKVKASYDTSKSLHKPKTKSQEEIVLFDTELEKSNRKSGIKFGKQSGEAVIPETGTTEKITFVVENEPAVSVAAAKPLSGSGEIHAQIKDSERPHAKISTQLGSEKPTEEPLTVTYVVETTAETARDEHVKGQKGSAEPETRTFVVEHDLPEAKVKLDKEKQHSWSLLGKIGGLHPEKDTSKPSTEPETVTFVVKQDLPKKEGDLDKEKEHSRSILGKTGSSLPDKHEDSKLHLNIGPRLKQQEIIVDEPHYFSEKKSPSNKEEKGLHAESLTITVQTEGPGTTTDEENTDKNKAWSLKWPTGEKKEKKEKKEPKRRLFQEEVVIDDAQLHMDQGVINPSFGHLPKGSAKVEGDLHAKADESMTFIVKEAPAVKISATKVQEQTKPEGEQETRFVVEGQLPETKLEADKSKRGSWNPFGKTSSEHQTSKNIAESETVTFVVEHDLPKSEVQLDKEKEHSWSLSGKLGSMFPEKETSKSAAEPQKVTYVVKQDLPETQVKFDKERVEQKDSAHKGHEHDKDHSWSLLGKIGSPFSEKSSSKSSLEPETVTYVVEGQPVSGKANISVDKPKATVGKTGVSVEGKRHRHQEELVVDDTHLFSDEADIKMKPFKMPGLTRKKEYKIEPLPESAASTISREQTAAKNHQIALATAASDDGSFKGTTEETVTFVVTAETPSDKSKPEEVSRKTVDKSWQISGFGAPTLFHKDDTPKAVEDVETVTYIVREGEAENDADKGGTAKGKKSERPLVDKKTTAIKPQKEKVTVSLKPKNEFQEEVIIDDTHLYTEKSEVHWPPFQKPSLKKEAGAQHDWKKAAAAAADAAAETSQETVTYTVTTEVVPSDLEVSVDATKEKPHKWKVFGKKSPKTGELSTWSGSLPSSASKDASLSRGHRQEEVVIGEEQYVTESSKSLERKKGKVDAGAKATTTETTTFTVTVDRGSDVAVNGTAKIQEQEPLVGKVELQSDLQTTPKRSTDSAEDVLLKFDLGNLKAIENVKINYLESPEPKKIVLGADPIKRTLLYDTDRAEPRINGFQDGGRHAERVEGFDRPSDDAEKQIAVKFETSTPKKEAVISTGAHGDALLGAAEADHLLDVTSSSDVSISFVPHAGGSFDGSSATGSRPSSFYAIPTVAGSTAPLPPHLVVIAIDFGTTFSGYAFSFSRDIDSIHVMRKWPDGDPGVVNQKTPTVLLLTPQGKFHSFGFTAKDFYHNLNPKEATKWLYFEKFKMALHYNADLSTATEIEASNGQSYPALTVFSHALRFFRDHALREVSDQSATRILKEDVRWVITVPAIWKAPAKQFMRQAAYQAGIASHDNPDQLLVALEPEAASVFIRKQRLQQLIPESVLAERPGSPERRDATPEPVLIDRVSQVYAKQDTNRWSQTLPSDTLSMSFQRAPSPLYTQVRVGEDLDITGTRYMVADCGGGTVDITVYELNADTGSLIELYKATGGPYGSMGVDLEFEALLVDIFSADFINVFKAKRPGGWVDLMMAFESRKRAATPIKSKPLNVSLPFSFMDYHKKIKNSTVESAIRKYNHKDIRWSSQGMLRLMPEAMTRLFQPTLDKIKEAIGNVLNNPQVKGIKYIFLVGGFAESPMIQVEMRNQFGETVKILIPADASLAILKGAVCFGNDPGVVKVRKSRMSYGLAVLNKFLHGKHPESKLAYKDGVEWCLDVFDPLVLADQSVALGSSVTRSYTPAGADQTFGNIDIYCSESNQVQFATDPGVTNCGKLRLDLSHLDQNATGGRRREVKARMTFGDTEIKVVAIDIATGNAVRASIDFLNK